MSLNDFKWNKLEFLKATIGVFLFCAALNIFIVPNNLYTAGVLGLSQIIRTLLIRGFDIHTNFDLAGIINLIINIPLFIIAYRRISKTFFIRTLYCVLIETIFLTIIPSPDKLLVEELITSVIIGGIMAGIGGGLVLSSSASLGGTDIIGVALTNRNRNLSVGKIGLVINIIIFITCGVLYGSLIMIYSIIYTAIDTLILDQIHDQNVCSTAMIFTKNKPTRLINYIKNTLDRDVTYWEAKGGYDHSKTYICYAVLSRYELQRLERNIRNIDEDAFLVKNDGVGINGNFQKVLVK
ncbi:MAG: YitT family protein [Bacilli bacterium]|nr:YitT family protein [Bacilli bacterium]